MGKLCETDLSYDYQKSIDNRDNIINNKNNNNTKKHIMDNGQNYTNGLYTFRKYKWLDFFIFCVIVMILSLIIIMIKSLINLIYMFMY